MDPPSYDQSIEEDECKEDGKLYYKVYINGSSSINFTILNSKGRVIDSSSHELSMMSKKSMVQISNITVSYIQSKNEYINYIIDDLVKYFGPMKLLYGTIRTQNLWPQNIPQNSFDFTFINKPSRLSIEPTLNIIHLPVESIALGSGDTTRCNGYIMLYYK